ncbi:hypothetical protein ACOY5X_20965 [Enterobacter kobei]|uniref:hypothetical protein n=1 Tax=Enterobacter kobei TaxID=208224 RepID=UPI003BEF2CE5
MDILNNIVSRILPDSNEHPGMMTFLSWVRDEGGLPSLLVRFRELEDKGLVSGTFTPEHIIHLFSDGELASLAQRMGLSSEEVTAWAGEHLPALLQHVSAGTQQQGGSNLLDVAWSFLRGQIK